MATEIYMITIAGNMQPLKFLETIKMLSGYSAIQTSIKIVF
jgi:hypothetical protein